MFTSYLPLLVSLIAGLFALIQIRSNNITNAKIRWLENLRHVTTDFFSEGTIIQLKEGISKAVNQRGDKVKIPDQTLSYIQKINESYLDHLKSLELKFDLIKLNLNLDEELHQKVEALLDKYMELFNEIPSKKTDNDYHLLLRKMSSYSDTIILLIRYIIKLEWEKTRRSYISRKYYMRLGSGRSLLSKAMNQELLPEKVPFIN